MIEIKNITKTIKKKEILKNISCSFEDAKTYGILGNNGVGKTTLLKIFFNEYEKDSGEILFNDNPIENKDYKDMFFYTENNQLPLELSVAAYCRYVFDISNIKVNLNEVSEKLIWMFDYKKMKRKTIKKLSEGEKKLLSLFILYILDPNIIFMDEPTTSLDLSNREILIKSIELFKKNGKTIVLITHHIEEVEQLLDHIIILKDGEVAYDQMVKKEQNIVEIYRNILGINNIENIMKENVQLKNDDCEKKVNEK